VGGGDDLLRLGELEESVVEPDLQAGEVEGVVAQLDPLAAQVSGNRVAIAVKGNGGRLVDFALGAVEESLAQFLRVGGACGGSGVLTDSFERGLTGLGVEFAVVYDLDPGQQGFVELGEGGDGGASEFGQKVGLNELEETLDLASAFGIVGSAEDALDAESGADGVQMLGNINLGSVHVDGQGAAVAQDGAFEAILHTGQLLVPVELSVRDEAGVIVEEGKEECLALLVGVGRIGEIRAVHSVPLPQVAKVSAFETAIGFGALLDEELGGGGAAAGQLAAQGARGNAFFGDRVGLVEGQYLDDGTSGTEGLLPLEGLGPVESVRRDGAGLAFVSSRLGFEAVESVLSIEPFPAGKGAGADGATGGVRDIVVASGDLLAQFLLASGWILAPYQGYDEGVAEEGDFGTSVFRVGHSSASCGQVDPSIAESESSRNAKLCW